MDIIKILLADDHPIVRIGLKNMLQHTRDFEIIGEATDGLDVITKTALLSPDVIIMDITMPKISGIAATKIIKQKFPKIKILAFSMYTNEESVLEMLKAGAHGYLFKTVDQKELIYAIRAIKSGVGYWSSKVHKIMVQKILKESKSDLATSLRNIHLQ